MSGEENKNKSAEEIEVVTLNLDYNLLIVGNNRGRVNKTNAKLSEF